MTFIRAHLKLNLFAVLLALCWYSSNAQAQAAFVVSSVNSELNDSVFFINAVFEINLPEYITSAVDQGFDLPLVMEVEGFRRRSMWFDQKIAYIKQQYQLRYHTLLDAVSILDINAGNRRFFASLDEAIAHLSVLIHYPALDNNTLSADTDYHARIRFGIDGAELPLPLKSSSLWKNDWDLMSDWVDWELNP